MPPERRRPRDPPSGLAPPRPPHPDSPGPRRWPRRTVIVRHGLRHAMLPVVTILGIGMGRLIIDSIVRSDYPMVQAAIIVLAASISLANVLVDLSYRVVDPRIRAGAA